MSCHYPSCMMGGGHCPHSRQCDEEAEKQWAINEAKRLLDLEEQKARIEYYKANTPTNNQRGGE